MTFVSGVVAAERTAGVRRETIRWAEWPFDSLAECGRSLALEEPIDLTALEKFEFDARLSDNQSAIRRNYLDIAAAAQGGLDITPAAQWLLDNYHVVEENFRHLQRDLGVGYFRRLPTVTLTNGTKVPRVLALIWHYVAATNSDASIASLSELIEGHQRVAALTIGELWAVPAILRLVLLENLRRLSDNVESARKQRRHANKLADNISRLKSAEAVKSTLDATARDQLENVFSAQLLYRFRDGSEVFSTALAWLEQALSRLGTDPESVVDKEHFRQSSGNVTTGNIITSLKWLNDVNWTDWVEAVSRVDWILGRNSEFGLLNRTSRNAYRETVEHLAARSPLTEIEIAEMALELADQRTANTPGPPEGVGYFLVGAGRIELERQCKCKRRLGETVLREYRRLGWFGVFAPMFVLAVMFCSVAAALIIPTGLPLAVQVALVAIMFIPAAGAAQGIVAFTVSHLVRPEPLPAFDYADGVPAEARTLVVIPCLLSNRDVIEELIETLERHYLANPRGEVYFALLSDWPDSAKEAEGTDTQLLDYAKEKIAELCNHYAAAGPRRFFLLHRRRLYNTSEGKWMGWERKRGKLCELNDLLRGSTDTTFLEPVELPKGKIEYVLTLDADTRLPRDVVSELAGKIAHPLNRPVWDNKHERVMRGYGLLQPRITPSLTTGDESSIFQRTFSSNRGMDPYVFTTSDLYQDLLFEGSFTGKGIYHVDTFRAGIGDRIPENTILSHDLIEGSWLRTALCTDVQLVEDFPVRYDVDASRQHRWIRGDWQLLPFLANFGNGLPLTARLKMLENLRRSLSPIAWVVASFAGWCLLDPHLAVIWQAELLILLAITSIINFNAGIVPSRVGVSLLSHLRALALDARDLFSGFALRLIFKAHVAVFSADAIVRTLFRLLVSRRNMLEWQTARDVAGSAGGTLTRMLGSMVSAPVMALAMGAAVAVLNPGSIPVALPFLTLWLVSPLVAFTVSRTLVSQDRLDVRPQDRSELRTIGRITWRYFEESVTAERNYLPPDNFQEIPEGKYAERTSPTNIALYLLSTISARDMGWISFRETVQRTESTLTTLEKLEKYKGHLYNWYDIRTLAVLDPRYVSTVDSGNLAGHLIAVSSTLRQWSESPAVSMLGHLDGIEDTLNVVTRRFKAIPEDRKLLRPLMRRLEERIEGFRASCAQYRREPQLASVRSINLSLYAEGIGKLARDLAAERLDDESAELVYWAEALKACCESAFQDTVEEGDTKANHRAHLQALSERARAIAFGMDFTCLYDPARRLFSIGYLVSEARLDSARYDLLASECRLASFFAIAKGDVPNEHWFRLGRGMVAVGWDGALVSWSGSMFEYLMAPLIMDEPLGGLLNRSSFHAIGVQREQFRHTGMPWGISECAIAARDHDMNYQYRAQGVPTLGLKRDHMDDLVVAPYATALAAQMQPHAAAENFEVLSRLGAHGKFGFYDALDFTPRRLTEGAVFVLVRNYMAHHQGMTIAAIANVVLEGIHRNRFHADPVVKATELLLQEKSPREIAPLTQPPRVAPHHEAAAAGDAQRQDRIIDPVTDPNAVCLLASGRYGLLLTANGASRARRGDIAVTRWSSDPLREDMGTQIFIRDLDQKKVWSATPGPIHVQQEQTRAIFSDHKAEYLKAVDELETTLECVVGSDREGEARRLTIRNKSDRDRAVDVTSYGEIVLAPQAADSAHPAFSKMFVETRIDRERGTIFARRQPRAADENECHLAHFIVMEPHARFEVEAETDRRNFIGRGADLHSAKALTPEGQLTGTDGFTLDPIFSLRRRIRLSPGQSARIVFWTIVADELAEVELAVEHYRHGATFDQEARMAWTRSQVQAHHIDVGPDESDFFRQLASRLVYPIQRIETAPKDDPPPYHIEDLWSAGVSGDHPILLLRIDAEADIAVVRSAMKMQEYFRARALTTDLVIINERASSYVQDLQSAILSLCEHAARRGLASGPGQHIFALRKDQLSDRTYRVLRDIARVTLHAHNGSLEEQVERHARRESEAKIKAGPQTLERSVADNEPLPRHLPSEVPAPPDLAFWNGFGGFDEDKREYVMRFRHGERSPQPWVNVIAKQGIGFLIAEDGASCTWGPNSRDFQITPWSNDPVSNRSGEAIYVVEESTGRVLSPFAAFSSDTNAQFEVRHGLGYSKFIAKGDTYELTADVRLQETGTAKKAQIHVLNTSGRAGRYRVFGYAEFVLGHNRDITAPAVQLQICDASDGAGIGVKAQNLLSQQFSDYAAEYSMQPEPDWTTTSRRMFLGAGGNLASPTIFERDVLPETGKSETGDPCVALAHSFELEDGEHTEVTFNLSIEQIVEAEPRSDNLHSQRAIEWEEFLGALQIETPDKKFDLLVNSWLPYQTLSCRILGRSAFYQASGAFGFRDQLQDSLALLLHDASYARQQVLAAAGRQFVEGDVQHWWLPATGAGVRTMISDDVVWLAHGVAEYVTATGDRDVLNEQIEFLTGEALAEGVHDAFFTPDLSGEVAPLYEHCARALDLAVQRTGPNRLPLFLGGDWNDGMNRVGEAGRGESIWLGWFLVGALEEFTPFALERGDGARVERWKKHRAQLVKALNSTGWDGEWYLRGIYDNGDLLGSHRSDECKIDAIAQSWSVLSGAGDPEKSSRAMDSVMSELVDSSTGILRLFTPAFSKTANNPGYIKGYPPGVRENGGQYTHAATWTVLALARMGRANEAYQLFDMINPISHAENPEDAQTYRVEPYVVAADVYGADDKSGRGGWTWYTGSAGWMLRVAVEGILGIGLVDGEVQVSPKLPDHWSGYSAKLRVEGKMKNISVSKAADGSWEVNVD